jgi:hypothetical protein
MPSADDPFLPTRKLRARYSKTDRTIRRWERDGVLPPAIKICGRKHWRLSDLERAERNVMDKRNSIIVP